ncbi:MAG: hypothetical protein JO061_04800 [Acidobacteriaceae bacterium]|nr:hypothetical protein [Acidobacteriaceae bacterium]
MSGTTSFQPTYNAATNRFNTLPAGSPSYDANGNLTAYNGQPYGWDAEGKAAYTVSGCQNSFIYDALGRWVETAYQQNANCNIPAWDMAYAPNGDKFLISTMPGDIYAEQYLQLSGGVRALAYASGFYSGLVAADLHPDWLGSTRMQTDSGSASSDNAYAPFGQMYVGGANTGYQFAGGGEYLGIAGWSFPARNYLPDQGRWMSPDPAGVAAVDPTDPQTWNRYVYVRNNPLAQTDPSGTDPCNVFNVTYEGSGSTFPCDASVALGGPTASPTSIAGGPGVAVGSMIGYQPPELAEGMNTYLANVRGGGYCGGPACGWGWVAGDDPALILGFVGLKNANINPGTAVMTEALLQEPSCAGLFGGFGSETALSLITRSTIVTGITFPTSAYATTNPDTKTITLNVPNPSGNPLLPDYPSPYLNQNAGAAAQTIIHELLHVAVGAFGPSAVHMPSWAGYPGVWTQVDDPRLDPYASVHNQQLVTGACPVGQ